MRKNYLDSPSDSKLGLCIFSSVVISVIFVIHAIEKYKVGWESFIPVIATFLLAFYSTKYRNTVYSMETRYNFLIDEIVKKFVNQESVNSNLREKAQLFQKACQRQTNFHAGDTSEGDLAEIQELIRGRKEEFWATHTLAKKLGFKVHDKVGGYLDKN